MKSFTKNEILGVAGILLVIITVTFYNLLIAERRARDAQRRADLGAIANALNSYGDDFGYFPPSEDGKIKACKGENFDMVVSELNESERFDRDLYFSGLRGCEWGEDPFRDALDEDYPEYLKSIPRDPKHSEGISYLYLSNTNRFQLYAYLEGELDAQGYNHGIVERSLDCGSKICSYGKSYGETPLDISIEEYEKELEERRKTGS